MKPRQSWQISMALFSTQLMRIMVFLMVFMESMTRKMCEYRVYIVIFFILLLTGTVCTGWASVNLSLVILLKNNINFGGETHHIEGTILL